MLPLPCLLLQRDMWELTQEALGKDFPQVIFPLLHERNVHLAGDYDISLLSQV